MQLIQSCSRRAFLAAGAAFAAARATSSHFALASPVSTPRAEIASLRQEILNTPLGVGLHRAKVFTRVFQETEDKPWVLRKAMALAEYFRSVPLYLRDNDGLAGSISEAPGAMPVIVELGIGENGIYTGERPDRAGYLRGQVPAEIREYWMNRNMWGLYRTEILGQPHYKSPDEVPQTLEYKFLSNQGHLSPSYSELLRVGIRGVLARVQSRRLTETDPEKQAFLEAAEISLRGLSDWIRRYADFLNERSKKSGDRARAKQLASMAQTAGRVALDPPETFGQAMQLVWFVHQAIHVEGHGYSNTPDRIDQLLHPFYEADRKAARLTDDDALRLVENFVLKMYDNAFWGPEHHLTQGLCVSGSTPQGEDQTNRSSWLWIEGATNLSLPEPLVWIRWHGAIDQKFFDFCLSRLLKSTCFPMMWNDRVVPAGLVELGVRRQDAFNYVAVGCNELAIPGQMHYNPGSNANYLLAIEAVLSDGKGYRKQWQWRNVAPAVDRLKSFDEFAAAVGAYLRRAMEQSYKREMQLLKAQIAWGRTALTSCFFDGCIEQGRDMAQGVKYNILSCGGIAFANAVDSMAAIREVVYDKQQATLEEVARACAANFQGHERLRARLLAAPKQGNDDPRLDEVIRLVERLRDEPLKQICRDPRDGSPYGNSHVVRSSAVRAGLSTPATPDGRLAAAPLASSVAASVGCERSGPTAVLNSVAKLDAAKSWQCGYQVNIRFHAGMVAQPLEREKLRAMLNVYFLRGGQELQINVVDSAALRAAQKNPEQYRDLVVRVAGFSEFFVNLTPDMQEEIIARTIHQ